MDNPAVSVSETPAKAFPSSSGEMFDQYFTQGSKCSYKKNDLLDPRARRLFEIDGAGLLGGCVSLSDSAGGPAGADGDRRWPPDADAVLL